MILGDYPEDAEPSEIQDRLADASDTPQDATEAINHQTVTSNDASDATDTGSSGRFAGLVMVVIGAIGLGLIWIGALALLNAASSTERSSATITEVTLIREQRRDRHDYYRVQVRLDDGTVQTRRADSSVGKMIDVGDSVRVERTKSGRVVNIDGGSYEISEQGPFSILMGLGAIAAGGWIVYSAFRSFVGDEAEDEAEVA